MKDPDYIKSMMAAAGPNPFLYIFAEPFKNIGLDKLVIIETPADVGMFPDTSGYTIDNYKEKLLELEDSFLYPYLTKTVDAVVDWLDKRAKTLEKLGYREIWTFLEGHNSSEAVYVIMGTVKAWNPVIKIR